MLVKGWMTVSECQSKFCLTLLSYNMYGKNSPTYRHGLTGIQHPTYRQTVDGETTLVFLWNTTTLHNVTSDLTVPASINLHLHPDLPTNARHLYHGSLPKSPTISLFGLLHTFYVIVLCLPQGLPRILLLGLAVCQQTTEDANTYLMLARHLINNISTSWNTWKHTDSLVTQPWVYTPSMLSYEDELNVRCIS